MIGHDRFKLSFAESIPYFYSSEYETHIEEIVEAWLDHWIVAWILDDGKNKGIIGFFCACLALFAKHCQWLESTVRHNRTICCTTCCSEEMPFVEHVTTCFPWVKTADSPQITRLPVDVLYQEKGAAA